MTNQNRNLKGEPYEPALPPFKLWSWSPQKKSPQNFDLERSLGIRSQRHVLDANSTSNRSQLRLGRCS